MREWIKQGRRVAAGAVLWGLAAAGAAAQTAAKGVNPSWLKADTITKVAEFDLVAGLTMTNGGMNFNGVKDGGLTFTVPVGWTVLLHVTNMDQTLPHSVEVIPDSQPVPTGPVAAAFPHAETSSLSQGLATEQKQNVWFLADRAGKYLIFCAVPGHGAAGMWIRLAVSAEARHPAIEETPKKG
ncbi:MAG TPA: sulfocyanin-like copper-binding protein [Gemmatimonadales bacterium]